MKKYFFLPNFRVALASRVVVIILFCLVQSSMAKENGVKFAMGTNNGDEDYANLDYCIEMIDACGLQPSDMFLPVPEGQKPIQVR